MKFFFKIKNNCLVACIHFHTSLQSILENQFQQKKKKKKTFTFKEEENKIKMVGCWKEMDMKNRKDKLF